jgi:hypothetical protein
VINSSSKPLNDSPCFNYSATLKQLDKDFPLFEELPIEPVDF